MSHAHDKALAGTPAVVVPADCPACETPAPRFFLRADARDYWRCSACEATFLDPAMLPDRAAEQAEYRLHRNDPDDAAYRQFLHRLAAPLLERLPPARRGLDFGCGPGPALAAMLREAGHSMALYDPFFCDDRGVLDDRYDFISCSETIEHFHRPAAEFRRFDRMLVPGGWLALMTSFQNDDAKFANWHYRRDPTHVVFFREATLRYLARQFGWHCEIPARNIALLQKPERMVSWPATQATER